MKVAIVHDYLVQMGGAERVVQALHTLFPRAPIYTALYDPALVRASFPDAEIHTSFLQRMVRKELYKFALPLYPTAFESFDLRGYAVVLSSSSSFAKGVITAPETCHICYCHTPARFAWRHHDYIGEKSLSPLKRLFLRPVLNYLRLWDVLAAQRVDFFIANSANVARRIRAFYRRDSTIIEPPVEIGRFQLGDGPGDFYLVVSRLLPYKRVDLAVRACNRLGRPLRVVGSGPEQARLRRMAGPTIRFLGPRTDEEVAALMRECRALILPGEEDFGITPLEAMASGRPVIAYGRGGARETVVPGATGMFFLQDNPECLAEAIRVFERKTFDPVAIRTHAERFGTPIFQRRVQRFVRLAYQRHRDYLRSSGRAAAMDMAVVRGDALLPNARVYPEPP